MNEALPLHQGLLLLMTADANGTSEVEDVAASYGLAAALIGELQLRGRLVARAANQFALATGPASEGALGLAEQRLAGFEGALQHAIPVVTGWTVGPLWNTAMEELAARGAVERAEDRLLGVRWRTRWPMLDSTLRRELVAHLRAHVARDAAEAPSWEDLLLSLARGVRVLPIIWPEPDALEQARPALDRCTARAPMGRMIRALIAQATLGMGLAILAGAS